MAASPNVQLAGVAGTLLPPTITGPIFKKASETSAVQQLARRVPLSMTAQTAIPIPLDVPTADWVLEGGSKPTASAGMGVKLMQGKKVSVLVPVSMEVATSNAAGLFDQLEQDLPTAIARAFDYAAIHGLALKGGGAGPFSDYLAATPNSVALGTAASNAGGYYTDLWSGISKVVNAPTQGYEFSGFAADPRFRPEAAISVDANGRPLFVDNALSANSGPNVGSLVSYPTFWNTGVSGKYYRQGDNVQVVTLVGSPTGGTFTVSVAGLKTAGIAFNATGATVQTAVQAAAYAGAGPTVAAANSLAGGITVTGGAGGPYTFTFTNGSGPITVDQTALTGGTAAASKATVAQSPVLDSGLRLIGGDWSQAAYGVGMDITIKVSTEAGYMDAGSTWHSAFQENLVLILAEAYYGFVMGDPNAFVAYTHAVGS